VRHWLVVLLLLRSCRPLLQARCFDRERPLTSQLPWVTVSVLTSWAGLGLTTATSASLSLAEV